MPMANPSSNGRDIGRMAIGACATECAQLTGAGARVKLVEQVNAANECAKLRQSGRNSW